MAADKAAEKTSELNLEWTRVTAPIDGRISKMNVTVGNLVNGGAGQATMLTTIVSVDPIYCYVLRAGAGVPEIPGRGREGEADTVRDAKIPCFIQLENETDFPHKGYIDFIDNSLDPNTGTIQVRGVIPEPATAI